MGVFVCFCVMSFGGKLTVCTIQSVSLLSKVGKLKKGFQGLSGTRDVSAFSEVQCQVSCSSMFFFQCDSSVAYTGFVV